MDEKLHAALSSVFTDDRRIVALENEVRDLKQLLKESEAKRDAAEIEVYDLKLTLNEMINASGATPPPHRGGARGARPQAPTSASSSASNAGKGLSSDKAKATILKLRMERLEQLRRQQKGEIKRVGLLCVTALTNFRREWGLFKATFVEQLERTEKTLVSAIAEASPAAHAAVVAHLHPPISSSHPVAREINALCDSMDSVVHVLQMQWYTFGCFSQGPVPSLAQARRYLDPVVNVATYTRLGEKLKQYVDFASSMNLVNSELRLPNLIQHTSIAVMASNSSYMLKLDRLFDAARLIRSPFHTQTRTLSLALRIILTVDVCRDDVTQILEKFDLLAAQHTRRCFQYICHTVCIGRRFAKVLQGVQTSRMRRFTPEELERMALEEHAQEVERNVPLTDPSNRPCNTCGVPMYCGDCSLKQRHSGELATLLEERRALMIAFTARRVEHFTALSAIADDTLKLLKRYKLAAPSANSTKPTRQTLAFTAAVTEKAKTMSDFVFQAEQQLRGGEGSRRAHALAPSGQYLVDERSYAMTSEFNADSHSQSPNSHQQQQRRASHAVSSHSVPQNSHYTQQQSAHLSLHPVVDWVPQNASQQNASYLLKSAAAPKPPPPAFLFQAEPSPPLVGPFGESVFPTEFYFKHRRAHTAQEERRRIMQQNATVMQDIASGVLLPCLTSPTKPSGASTPSRRPPTSESVRLGNVSPRVGREPQYLSARLLTPTNGGSRH